MAPYTPTVGDRVGVPWGLDVLEGVILRTYDSPSGTRAVVSVDVPGANDETSSHTVTLPLAELHPAGEGHELETPGSWINEYQFTKSLQRALTRAILQLAAAKQAELETEPRLGRYRPDALVRLGNHFVVVEAKTAARSPAALNQLRDYVDVVRDLNPNTSVEGMLIVEADPANDVLREFAREGFAVVVWNNRRDDAKLAAALASLLA